MVRAGVSVIVGSRDAALRPSIMRGVGSDVSQDGRAITVYLCRSQSRQLLQDIAATGHVSVVFSQPTTHRTLQLKATRAELRAAGPDDQPVLQRYLAAMEREISAVGYSADLARAMLAHRLDDVGAVRFVPEQAFDQTPGPQAGSRGGATP